MKQPHVQINHRILFTPYELIPARIFFILLVCIYLSTIAIDEIFKYFDSHQLSTNKLQFCIVLLVWLVATQIASLELAVAPSICPPPSHN